MNWLDTARKEYARESIGDRFADIAFFTAVGIASIIAAVGGVALIWVMAFHGGWLGRIILGFLVLVPWLVSRVLRGPR
jgi:hypothetical protein